MPAGPWVRRVTQSARDSWTLRHFALLARARKPKQPLCVVYGNCQAEPIRTLLAGSTAFADAYETVRIPPVHEITVRQLEKLHRLLGMTSLIVAQPIKDGYRRLPLGINQIRDHAPTGCKIIRFPALHYDALYPFQVTILLRDWFAVPAPITVYHDLRTLCAAARGSTGDSGARWVSGYEPPEPMLRVAAEEARTMMRHRESKADIQVLDWITASPESHADSFFTISHPSLRVLNRIAESVHEILGLSSPTNGRSHHEPLGVLRTPLEQPVIDVLGLASAPRPDWTIKGKTTSMDDVVRRQLAWYRDHPEVVEAGVSEHADRIAAFSLL